MGKQYKMDFGWKFRLGELSNDFEKSHSYVYMQSKSGAIKGVAGREFNDSDWRDVDLPHDYMVEAEFNKENLLSSGYKKAENAWYRKTFLLDEEVKDKSLYLCFEGTAVNAEFYFNGSLLARSFSGYSETFFEITDRAYFGDRPNILAVHINGTAKQGWWYEGAGIYRHVYLYAKNPLHIAHNGTFVKPALLENTENDWSVLVETELQNDTLKNRNITMHYTVFDGDNAVCTKVSDTTKIPDFETIKIKDSLSVLNPKRWDVDAPNLYSLLVEVYENGVLLDSEKVKFGFRTFYIDANKGFFLNGRQLKLKGTCNHQDHAGVGVAVPDRLQYHRVILLKEMGANAYRTAHNIPAKEILDACDELGIIVMDENRVFETHKDNLCNLVSMIKRDRNHPSVIFYSMFNEEPMLQTTEEGAKMFNRMKNTVRKLDDTRIITGAINSFEPYDGAGKEMDALGINYGLFSIANVIEDTHKILPNMPIIGTETGSCTTTRGEFITDKETKQVLKSYDEEKVSWGATVAEQWDFCRKNDYYSGIFIWTGFDYRGEPTPFKWPAVSSQFGIFDTCGFKKSAFYYCNACFGDKPMLKLIPHWNWQTGDSVRVVAITNCEEVELFLNGESEGRKKADCCCQPEWNVDFVKGNITAVGYIDGKAVLEDKRFTALPPKTIKAELVYNTANDDGQDVIIMNCSVLDENGNEHPTADNKLYFNVEGDAVFLGAGNGNPNSHEADSLPERKLFNGKAQAIFRALRDAKNIKITVSGEGLESAVIEPEIITVNKPLSVESTVDYNLYELTQSVVLPERPDPLMQIADNDMNSFTACKFSYEHFQYDFKKGYRIYRAKIKADYQKSTLLIGAVMAGEIEIYYDNNLLLKADNVCDEKITCQIDMKPQIECELRILIKGERETLNGIKSGVMLIPES